MTLVTFFRFLCHCHQQQISHGRHQEEDAGDEDREGKHPLYFFVITFYVFNCNCFVQDNALDRADAAEEKVRQTAEKLERVEEELRDTQKKMMQTENDLDKAQEDLSAANTQLEEKEKKVQEVSRVLRGSRERDVGPEQLGQKRRRR